MGIYERDYVRREPPRPGTYGSGGISAMKMWSANTWIIIICVVVFMIDSLTPMQYWSAVEVSRDLPPTVELSGGAQYVVVASKNERALLARSGQAQRQVFDQSTSPATLVGTTTVSLMPPLQRWFHFSTTLAFQKLEVWRFIGFQFLHANLTHLLFNMVGLFFFGPMVERFLGSKRYIAFYLLCGIFGAIMYLLLNVSGFVISMLFGQGVMIPGLLFNSTATPLIGASAGVFGVLMAGAFLAPNATVLLFFILPMRLKTLAYALVAVALFTIIVGGSNAGGEAGHLGGAIAGFYFIRRPQHLHGFFDLLGWVDPTSHHYRNKRKARTRPGKPDQVDAILDKVSKKGVQSLSAKEKKILRQASEE